MDAAEVEALFTREDGSYLCARWGRPLVPIVFGIEDATLSVVKGAFEVVCAMSGHKMAEHDPELGANVMVFFFRDWAELLELPDLGRMIDGLPEMVARLQGSGANQYRVFRFDRDGSIKAAFVFLRMDESLSQMPAEDLALAQVAQVMLTWGNGAFAARSPLGRLEDGRVVLRPEIGALIRAAYDPVMPVAAQDASHALRLAARTGLG
ncbi:hypothetical protein [Alloyangia pacifica]|uniref:Uncharacterized protein n=1 Tax=Alloyangia pacifica TaxID=311180 RepID=A0A1I6S3B3_9RHOB|nr:hypothetical protein [Alloyangia pacifica]SDG70169.1 hypothetical protein SAMN04488245_10497 [Alloyangia pacifica]SFS71455.1 hypothetical protein SAMN04488050_10497 [Alloyangia pacifica]